MQSQYNLTREVLGPLQDKQKFPKLTEFQKKKINAWINSLFEAIDTFTEIEKVDPETALKMYSSVIDQEIHTFYKLKSISPILKRISSVLTADYPYRLLGLSLNINQSIADVRSEIQKYVRYLIYKKIFSLATKEDLLNHYFSSHFNKDKEAPIEIEIQAILDLMNILTKAKRFIADEKSYLKEAYSKEHKQALLHLLFNEHLTEKEALKEIVNINNYQAEALIALYHKELRGNHLRIFEPDLNKSIEFSDQHCDALIFLTKAIHLKPKDAMTEIKGLTEEQVIALKELYPFVKGEELRKWRDGNKSFGQQEFEALKPLLFTKKMPAEEALQAIKQQRQDTFSPLRKWYEKGLKANLFSKQGNLGHAQTKSMTQVSNVKPFKGG